VQLTNLKLQSRLLVVEPKAGGKFHQRLNSGCSKETGQIKNILNLLTYLLTGTSLVCACMYAMHESQFYFMQ